MNSGTISVHLVSNAKRRAYLVLAMTRYLPSNEWESESAGSVINFPLLSVPWVELISRAGECCRSWGATPPAAPAKQASPISHHWRWFENSRGLVICEPTFD